MLKNTVMVMALAGILFGCASSSKQTTKPPKPTGQPPVIVDYYAEPVIRPGETWKFYLQAHDKDGDMKYIAALLFQAGVGYYPTSATYLGEEDRGEVSGYVFLVTPSNQDLASDRLELTIVVWDQQGNSSKAVKLQLAFGYESTENIPPKWLLADKNSLGSMRFNIRSPGGGGDR
jgi:hypothetical protein